MIAFAAVLAFAQPDFELEFDKLHYQNVQFALADGSPDRTRPVNSWEEVKRSRRLVTSFSNGISTPSVQNFRTTSVGSIYRYESEPLPKGAVPFTLPAPDTTVLNIEKPKNLLIVRDVVVAPMQNHTVYSVDQTTIRVESRFYKGKEYLRYESTNSVLRYDQTFKSIQ